MMPLGRQLQALVAAAEDILISEDWPAQVRFSSLNLLFCIGEVAASKILANFFSKSV
jgi:hypothetical protein